MCSVVCGQTLNSLQSGVQAVGLEYNHAVSNEAGVMQQGRGILSVMDHAAEHHDIKTTVVLREILKRFEGKVHIRWTVRLIASRLDSRVGRIYSNNFLCYG